MARPLRIEYEGAFYHVTSRGNERKKIYYAKSDYEKFKSYLKDGQDKYGYLLHCYVLMANHYHLLLETPQGNLQKVMHHINGSYTGYINRRRKRSGHLFQGRYKAILIDRDNYLLELSRYIHLNPVRAGIVEKPEDYPYSSYKSYIARKKEDIVYRDLVLGIVSKGRTDARRSYQLFIERGIGEADQNPLKEVYGGCILGRKRFIKEALGRLKDGIGAKEEISRRKELQFFHECDEIIDIVSEQLEVPRDELFRKRGWGRDLTIHLMKKYSGMTNKEIGRLVGGLSYSAVTRARERFLEKTKKDRGLRKKAEKISAILSNVKG